MAYGALLPAVSVGDSMTTSEWAAVCLCVFTVLATLAGIIWTLPSRSHGTFWSKYWEALVSCIAHQGTDASELDWVLCSRSCQSIQPGGHCYG